MCWPAAGVLCFSTRQASEMAERVAGIVHEETGLDPQLAPFRELASQYTSLPH